MKACAGCGEDFAPGYPEQKYHSHACFLSSMNRDPARQSRKGKKGGDVRGQQIKASASGTGYVKVPGTDIHEHRAVAEQVLGRSLYRGEVVHHEDLNKQNNHPFNLIVFRSQAEHSKHHKLGHPGLDACECNGIRLKEVMPNAAS